MSASVSFCRRLILSSKYIRTLMKQYSQLVICYIVGPILIVVSHLGSLLIINHWLIMGCCLVGRVVICNTNACSYRHLPLGYSLTRATRLNLSFMRWKHRGCFNRRWGPVGGKLTTYHRTQTRKDPHSPICLSKGLKSSGGLKLDGYSPHSFSSKLPPMLKVMWFWRLLTVALHSHRCSQVLSYYIGGAEYLGAFFPQHDCHSSTVSPPSTHSTTYWASNRSQPTTTVRPLARRVSDPGWSWHNLVHFQSSARHSITVREGQVAYLEPNILVHQILEFPEARQKIRCLLKQKNFSLAPKRNQGTVFKAGQSIVWYSLVD